jgi:hypothetical protein
MIIDLAPAGSSIPLRARRNSHRLGGNAARPPAGVPDCHDRCGGEGTEPAQKAFPTCCSAAAIGWPAEGESP